VNRVSFVLLAFVVIAPTFGKEPAPDVTFVSPCECIGFHGIHRWVTKTDQAPVPSDKSAIQSVTPKNGHFCPSPALDTVSESGLVLGHKLWPGLTT
jgi:hypothetical protein